MGSGSMKEFDGSWQQKAAKEQTLRSGQGQAKENYDKPVPMGVLSQQAEGALRLPTRRALFRAPTHGVAETPKNLSADAKMSVFPFSSQRNLENNTSDRLRDQTRAAQNGCLVRSL